MNPWAFIVIALGVILIMVGVKGNQHNLAAAVTGHSVKMGATPSGNAGSSTRLA